jgi:hypothetical protein
VPSDICFIYFLIEHKYFMELLHTYDIVTCSDGHDHLKQDNFLIILWKPILDMLRPKRNMYSNSVANDPTN